MFTNLSSSSLMGNTRTTDEIEMVLAIIRDIETSNLNLQDVALLEQVAFFASSLAQEVRTLEDALMAQIDEMEALNADRLMCESDAADHSLN